MNAKPIPVDIKAVLLLLGINLEKFVMKEGA
jgi:hypothetical protein